MSEQVSEVRWPIRTRLVRSNLSRTFSMNGAWGSITPQGAIHMALYSERWNTPEETVLRLEEGRITDIPDPEKNERMLIREIEADIFLSEESAVSLVKWLNTQIGKLREIRQLEERKEEK